MKKIYSFAFAMLSFAGLQAQSLNVAHADRKMEYQQFQGRDNGASSANRDIIWSDDFSNPDNWIIAHDGTFDSDFEIGTGLVSDGQYGTPAILSTTAANGYAMYNSDGFGNQNGSIYEQAHITTATPINLSAYQNLVLSFETQYRRFTPEQTYLIVSTDGNFPTLDDPAMDISGMPGVYKVWEQAELTNGVSPGNPTTRTFNISEIAGGASQVWVRLQFTGIWGYAWYIDDIAISEQFAHDAKLFSAYASHVAGSGLEYARIPQLQVPAEMNVGCYVKNEGSEPMTNLSVDIWLGDFNYNQTQDELLPGDTMFVDGFITSPTEFGFHELYYGVTSDQSATDGNAANNEAARYYEMTVSDYSMDGIDVHPSGGIYSALGTNSFTDNADELMLFTYYEILEPATVLNVNIQLASGTVAGGQIFVQVHLGDDILVNDIIDNPLGSSDTDNYTVTEADVAAGFVTIPLTDPLPLDAGGYCVSAMLFSNGNTNDIRVLDDNTVPQPNGASMIYIPSDATIYTNGNALAIRMGFDGTINVQEAAAQLDGVNVFPNPSSNGIVNIVTNKGENLSVEVFDSVGALVDTKRFYMNTALDVSSLAKGVYTVRVNSANASSTKMVTIQ
jgi:hypothetical protein